MRNGCIVSLSLLWVTALAPGQTALANDTALPIGTLAFRDHVVAISSSPEGLRYAVRTAGGTLLGEDLTADQLSEEFPELASRIRSSHASDTPGGFVWAGRDESMVESPLDATTDPE